MLALMASDRDLIASLVRSELAKARISPSQVVSYTGWASYAVGRRLRGEVEFRGSELLALSRLLGIHPGRFLQDAAATTPPAGIPVVAAEAVS